MAVLCLDSGRDTNSFCDKPHIKPLTKNSLLVSVVDLFLPAIWAFGGLCRLSDSPYMIRSMEEEFQRKVRVRQWSTLGICCCLHAVQRESLLFLWAQSCSMSSQSWHWRMLA
ncbi:uncharacterized protein LOC111275818 isoform X1 [Durio zibethinus]|uniref:Uncharacterized protein LOC111275818 isoform X1 n=1 Tax=Durio zibethinus TaxID=66656 RepID=A0A6P5WLV0_DURZI|nr:uncharacterized protein LOC111275818 isoform X1 [Durio zibethinus]